MKGSYWFKAKSKKVLFEFSIRRNITVIKGDSATGKTTLLRILYEYLRIGRQSGYAVSTNASYYVYIRDEVGRDWKDALYPLKNTVIFIEENYLQSIHLHIHYQNTKVHLSCIRYWHSTIFSTSYHDLSVFNIFFINIYLYH